ncbi:MAG TPA: STAS domain-containing protein [Armatimonadota bacterium]|nr:STAS domain-containing protein [Armatimonadota bacterium]
MQVENVRLETAVKKVSGIPVVKVAGEIDVYTAPEFKSAINEAISSGAADQVIDLADVSYMDSSGFGILLGAAKRVRPKGGSISLVGCSETIQRMLRITGLDTIFGMFANLDDAVAAIKG